MSFRWIGRAILVLAGLACLTPVQAENPFHCIARDIKRRNCWPEPFVYPDRQATREPFFIMVGNGWQQQNMLAEHHFEAGVGQLTEAGRLKVQWVLNEAPAQHRAIYVHRGANPEETANRVAAVQQLLVQSTYPGDPMVPVFETNRPSDGWPAERIDAIGRRFQASTPDPKLPPKEAATGSSN